MDIVSDSKTDETKQWATWLSRIEARKKTFANGWWKQAARAEKMYDVAEGSKSDENPFNILYANTEVLLPSLYSATPRPEISPRNKKGKQEIAQAVESLLTTVIDMNLPGKETFDDAVESSVLSSLVPGCGHVRVRVYPGEVCPIRMESGNYDTLIWGKASKWSRVPWIAFIHKMTKEDIVKEFEIGEEDQKLLKVPTQQEADESGKDVGPDSPVYVYELWNKAEKEVAFLCEGYDKILLRRDDENLLALPGFYPTPGPLGLVKKSSGLDPTPLFEYYRNQAEELNRVTVRLNKVLSAIRVRGAYNLLLGDEIKNILADGNMENALVPTGNPMDLLGKGFEGHIWFMPLEQLIVVAKELYVARMQIMNVIQQITGLSDIVRGSSAASETATAQNLKNKWGTIRLKRMQRIVSFYVRELLRLIVPAAAHTLGEEEWKGFTQLDYPTSEEKAQAQAAMQQAVEQAAMQGQPPQPDPKLMEVLSKPSWEEIISTLKDDNGRVYSIDIETNTTVDVDATQDKEEVIEYMGMMAQLVTGLQPLASLGPSGIDASKQILIAVTSKFKFGREVIESLKKLEAPPPQEDPKAKAENQKMQAEMQMKQQEHEGKMALEQEKMAHEREKLAMDKERMAMEMEMLRAKHAIEMAKLQMGMRVKEEETQMKGQELAMTAQANERNAALQEHQGRQKLEQSEAAHKQKMKQAKEGPKPKQANSRPT